VVGENGWDPWAPAEVEIQIGEVGEPFHEGGDAPEGEIRFAVGVCLPSFVGWPGDETDEFKLFGFPEHVSKAEEVVWCVEAFVGGSSVQHHGERARGPLQEASHSVDGGRVAVNKTADYLGCVFEVAEESREDEIVPSLAESQSAEILLEERGGQVIQDHEPDLWR